MAFVVGVQPSCLRRMDSCVERRQSRKRLADEPRDQHRNVPDYSAIDNERRVGSDDIARRQHDELMVPILTGHEKVLLDGSVVGMSDMREEVPDVRVEGGDLSRAAVTSFEPVSRVMGASGFGDEALDPRKELSKPTMEHENVGSVSDAKKRHLDTQRPDGQDAAIEQRADLLPSIVRRSDARKVNSGQDPSEHVGCVLSEGQALQLLHRPPLKVVLGGGERSRL
ncbi:MAG TPA: hypothetical protein VGM91_10295, partial [Conexibacter sp.]